MSADTIQAMRDRLLCAASDETYLEFETELTLDGHPSLCQIAIQTVSYTHLTLPTT